MKFTAALLLAPLALASAVPKERKVSYDGYKAVRIATHHNATAIKDALASLHTVPFNFNNDDHLDVAIAPEDLKTFEKLGLDTITIHEDLGKDIAEEAKGFAPYESEHSLILRNSRT